MEIVAGLHCVDRIWDARVYLWIEGDRATAIDTATPGRAGAVLGHLATLGFGPGEARPLAEIWLTHADVDHMGSAAALKEQAGAHLVAHRDDVAVVEGRARRQLGSMPLTGAWQRLYHWSVGTLFHYRPATVDRAVEDGDWLGSWEVVHVPGHTPGSVCFYHPERRIVVVGDAINHRRGELGIPPRAFSPDMRQARASISRIAALDFDVCCFGHGPPLLENARARVQALAEKAVG